MTLTNVGILIFDGVEHLSWLSPTAPGQSIGSGPNGEIAFVNPCGLVEHCTQTPFMNALLEQNAKIAEALRILAGQGKPKASRAKKPPA